MRNLAVGLVRISYLVNNDDYVELSLNVNDHASHTSSLLTCPKNIIE